MQEFVDAANQLMWGSLLIWLLLGAGLLFTVLSGFIQVRHFGHTFGVMKRSFRREHGGISSFEAYCTSLGARVGTGNLAGVAVALELGGPGAVFWMWVTAMLGMATSFFESTLAQLFKVPNGDGSYRGGPAFYMQYGLGKRWMGILFSVFLIVSYPIAFNGVQSNSMSAAVEQVTGIDAGWTGLLTAFLVGLVIFGGIRRIARVAEIVVPFMAIAYLGVALWLVLSHLDRLPGVVRLVFESAFGIGQAAGGVLGYGIAQALINGVRRGLFSNEAGSGSAPIAAATADVRHPASQGYVQMLGVFTDTIVICSCTAAIILVSGQFEAGAGVTGMALTQGAMSALVGDWGAGFMAVALLFFAFTSIMANTYYGETSLAFIRSDQRLLTAYRCVVLAGIFAGSQIDLPLVWAMADLSMAFMTIVNLVAVLLLSGLVIKVMRDYNSQLALHVEPVFDLARFPDIARRLPRGGW
ncbi:MAG TPA: alanine/glycine:cation symporter family protein [Gammaproteobacteria bacterium]|nr:alanine/glycine:cation symporter family protein [Gammaproteobacteria bacterium]HRP85892.1 alanine/glycine:cation symporter family protein [Gammaproteobacteria bacterium]